MRKESDVRDRLRQSFRWRGDRTDPDFRADITGWWRSPDTLLSLGPGLAALFADSAPTVVMGTESHGSLLGVLTAQHLGVGFAEVRKDLGGRRTVIRGGRRRLVRITSTETCDSGFADHY